MAGQIDPHRVVAAADLGGEVLQHGSADNITIVKDHRRDHTTAPLDDPDLESVDLCGTLELQGLQGDVLGQGYSLIRRSRPHNDSDHGQENDQDEESGRDAARLLALGGLTKTGHLITTTWTCLGP